MKPLLVIFLLCSVSYAQSPLAQSPKEPNPFGWQFKESSLDFWAGTTVAYHSSYGKRELNPLLRNSDGRPNGPLFWSLNGALYGTTVLLQRKYPNRMNWLRRVMGVVHIGTSVSNYRQLRER